MTRHAPVVPGQRNRLSEPADATVKHPGGRALVRHVAPPTAGVADDGRHAVAADVPLLAAHAARDVAEGAAVDLRGQGRRLWTAAGEMPGDVAEVADRVVVALPGYVAWLATVVAGAVVSAVDGNVAWLETVVA